MGYAELRIAALRSASVVELQMNFFCQAADVATMTMEIT
jgi:hypothetical protein